MKSEVFKTWTLVLQLGITMMVPILLFVAIGYFVKERFSIDLMLALIIIGVIVGIRNVKVLLVNFLNTIDNSKNKESELLKKHKKNNSGKI